MRYPVLFFDFKYLLYIQEAMSYEQVEIGVWESDKRWGWITIPIPLSTHLSVSVRVRDTEAIGSHRTGWDSLGSQRRGRNRVKCC